MDYPLLSDESCSNYTRMSDVPEGRELLLCIPGPWKDRSDFIASVVSKTEGEFVFAGKILACPHRNDHVVLDFEEHTPQMRKAFEFAGQGKLPAELLDQLDVHAGVAYLHFPVKIIGQRERLALFTNVLMRCGGFAVKVESAGIAHTWDEWFKALASENPFDLYRTFVVLIGDKDYYFSCGMHHFGLPEVEVSRSIAINEAADLMNRFNYWQIVEEPKIAVGHTFSIAADAARYHITLKKDLRHVVTDFFHNEYGVWSLERVR
jgi:hypothetical protein